jgi:hypothetical protein
MWSAECYGYREAAHDAGIRVTILQLAVLAFLACASGVHAGEQVYSPVNRSFVYVGWQDPAFLPRRFRNHCSFDVTLGAYYCSDRCGSDYQFYYCSRWSFGCCHIGVGYCDWGGLLRCRP